jgi:hypothetical protein
MNLEKAVFAYYTVLDHHWSGETEVNHGNLSPYWVRTGYSNVVIAFPTVVNTGTGGKPTTQLHIDIEFY